MPPTIYDSSLLTLRKQASAQAGSFLTRINNPVNPNTSYAPALGIYDDSILANVRNGQMKYYRKGGGVFVVNNGCPCQPLVVTNPNECPQ
jgi:hypothetical protein